MGSLDQALEKIGGGGGVDGLAGQTSAGRKRIGFAGQPEGGGGIHDDNVSGRPTLTV